jgi:holo-[acyl-carrier protein] synthase
MDIAGIGIEIVECVRIMRMIERHGELFLTRVFTDQEIRYCQQRQRTNELFAAHWAAKEAILKCLATSWHRQMPWTDLEIRHEDLAHPRVVLHGLARDRAQELRITEIHLSLAHCRSYATAYALAIRKSSW